MQPMGYLAIRVRSFLYGASLPLRSLRLIASHPKLCLWSLFPIAVTLALYGYAIGGLKDWVNSVFMSYFQQWGWNPEGWMAWLVLFFTKLLLFLVGALTFSISAAIVSSPFNDFLAEAAEPYTDPPLQPVGDSSFSTKLRLILVDVGKTLAAAVATILALLLSWVPILNILAFALAFLLVTFQYVTYPQTRRGVGLKDGLRFLNRHFFACLGFGMVFSLFFSIPLVSCVFLPLAVVSGTQLFARATATVPALPEIALLPPQPAPFLLK